MNTGRSGAGSSRKRHDRSAMSAQENKATLEAYWRRNLRLTLTLLFVWLLFGFIIPIVMAPALNSVVIGGFPLGFWFAQQGSIYVFVVLILIYAVSMGRIDQEFDVQE